MGGGFMNSGSTGDTDNFERVREAVIEFGQKWRQFCQTEWPSQKSAESTERVKKRRVKPTLVTHIGLPSSQFRHISADPILSRNIPPQSEASNPGSPSSIDNQKGPEGRPVNLPQIKVSPENERRIQALVVSLTKARLKSVRGYLELCEILFTHLRTLHTIFLTDEKIPTPGPAFILSSLKHVDCESMFEDVSMSIYFGVELLKAMFSKICKLNPSFVGLLEGNKCLRKLCAKLFTKLSPGGRSSLPSQQHSSKRLSSNFRPAVPEIDAFDTIAYVDKRDSRNFSQQPHLHSNQQKVRDLFLEFIRSHGSDFIGSSPTGGNDYPAKRKDDWVRADILGRLHKENYGWFAELLIFQYDQMRKRLPSLEEGGSRGRLEKLEERLTTKKPFDLEQSAIVQFISLADSHKLHCILVTSLRRHIFSAERLIIEGRRSAFIEDSKRIAHLAKLLAILEEADTTMDLVGLLEEAIIGDFVLLRAPWILSYIQHSSNSSLKEKVKSYLCGYIFQIESKVEFSRRDLIMYLMCSQVFQDLPSSYDWIWPKKPKREEEDLSKLSLLDPIDYDLTIEVEQLLLPDNQTYTHLIGLLKLRTSIEPSLQATPPSPESPPNLYGAKVTRKIRPVLVPQPAQPEPRQTDFNLDEEAKLQAQLRHWYWWQWRDLKEYVDSLVKYAVTEVLRPDPTSPKDESERLHDLILASLPPLLPALLRNEPQAVDLAVALTLELATALLNTLKT